MTADQIDNQSEKTSRAYLFLGLIILLAIALRLYIDFKTQLMPGVNAIYYPVQVRSLLENGHLAFSDLPLVFYLEAFLAKVLAWLGFCGLESCIMLSSKIIDATLYPLIAIPFFLLARAIIGREGPRWIPLLISALTTLSISAFIMMADFQKNSIGLMLSAFLIYFLYKAAKEGRAFNYILVGVFLLLTGLTHLGGLGFALAFSVGFLFFSIIFKHERRIDLIKMATLLFLVIASIFICLFFFDFARFERLVGAVFLPLKMFKQPIIVGIFKGQIPLLSPDFSNAIIDNPIAIIGLILLIAKRREISSQEKILFSTSLAITFFLTSPFLGAEWANRFYLMAYIPASIVFIFLLKYIYRKWLKILLTVLALLVMVGPVPLLVKVRSAPSISIEAYNNLSKLKTVISNPEKTLIITRHGLEWWTAWVLRVDVSQKPKITEDTFKEYDHIYYLRQNSGQKGFGPFGPGGPSFPEVVIPPKAPIVYQDDIFILAEALPGFLQYHQPQTSGTKSQVFKLDAEKKATHLSRVAGEKSAYWMRGLPFVWNDIEKKQGNFEWSTTDDAIIDNKGDYFSGDVYHLVIIWPYANWDQNTCHQGDKYQATGHLKKSDEDLKMGAPCDIKAYANFVEKVVERYDGDGVNDAPGLKTPIKYWEIMNEPEMQGGGIGGAGEELKFFVGTPQEYLEILKTSYGAVKKADSEAKVSHAGMAGMQQNFQDFWNPIFAGGGGSYFDIANIHTINTDEKREDMYVMKFKKYLEKFGIKGKPVWVTEVQFGELMDKPKDIEGFNRTLAKSSVFALAQGADKLFYIENWTTWDNPDAFKPSKEGEKDKKEAKPKIDFSNNPTHKVYLNLVNKINSFNKIEALQEKFTEGKDDNSGVTSQIGQYKFVNGDKVVYVLWGSAQLPAEISGKVKVIDIYGEGKEMDAKNITLSNNPIFVEKL